MAQEVSWAEEAVATSGGILVCQQALLRGASWLPPFLVPVATAPAHFPFQMEKGLTCLLWLFMSLAMPWAWATLQHLIPS